MPTPYDLNLPCLNPNCHSHGRPHPNCRCYGFAEGGEVTHFCSEARDHQPDCEYHLSNGGDVQPKFEDTVEISKAPDTSLDTKIPTSEAQPKFEETVDAKKEQQPHFNETVGVNEGTPLSREEQLNKEESNRLDFTKGLDPLKSAARGAAQAIFGDLEKAAEVKTGISTIEDIEKNQNEFPGPHLAGKMIGSVAAWEAAGAVTGSKMLSTILMSYAPNIEDSISKALLDQPGGDFKSAASSALINGTYDLFANTLASGLFSHAESQAKKILNEKTAQKAKETMEWLAKDSPASGALDWVVPAKVTKIIEKFFGNHVSKANKYIGDAAVNGMAKANYFGIPSAIKYANHVSNGLLSIKEPIESLFKAGLKEFSTEGKQEIKDLIEEYQDRGGIEGEFRRDSESNQKNYATGGDVSVDQSNHFASLYPRENSLLYEAKGRISNYLGSIKPHKNQSKLAFDAEPKQTQKKASYKKALDIAANPISVLAHMNKGTLTTELMTHFKAMYPQVHEFLSQKITDRIIKAQLNGEKPPYRKRQAMSLFLGADLDSTFTPQSILAVQSLYAAKKSLPMPNNKKGTSSLSKSSSQYQTDEQSREKRMQNQKA